MIMSVDYAGPEGEGKLCFGGANAGALVATPALLDRYSRRFPASRNTLDQSGSAGRGEPGAVEAVLAASWRQDHHILAHNERG